MYGGLPARHPRDGGSGRRRASTVDGAGGAHDRSCSAASASGRRAGGPATADRRCRRAEHAGPLGARAADDGWRRRRQRAPAAPDVRGIAVRMTQWSTVDGVAMGSRWRAVVADGPPALGEWIADRAREVGAELVAVRPGERAASCGGGGGVSSGHDLADPGRRDRTRPGAGRDHRRALRPDGRIVPASARLRPHVHGDRPGLTATGAAGGVVGRRRHHVRSDRADAPAAPRHPARPRRHRQGLGRRPRRGRSHGSRRDERLRGGRRRRPRGRRRPRRRLAGAAC